MRLTQTTRISFYLHLVLLASSLAWADAPARTLLVFMQPADALDPVGMLSFDANALIPYGDITLNEAESSASRPAGENPQDSPKPAPSFMPLLAVAQPDGSSLVYGTRHEQTDSEPRTYRWRLFRGRTPDGYRLTEFGEVFRNPEGPWLIESAMARQDTTGRLFFFTWSRSDQPQEGHALWGFFSDDGHTFETLADHPVYLDHDAFGMMWDARTNRLLTGQVTYQPWEKRYPDNMGPSRRRVLSIRTSPDGREWMKHPEVGKGGLITPDDRDPPEVEFYRMQPFAYGDRYVAMANLYAPSPLMPNVHGPHLGCQWWVSDDGMHWHRPWRGVDAQGDATYPIKMTPMWFGKRMLFWIGGRVWGLPEYRIASVGAQANAEFSTRTFTMPDQPLLLNASVPQGYGLFNQAYVQVELRDEAGKAVPGYEYNHCLLARVDDTRIPLRWQDRTGTEQAGKRVSLRFRLRSARIYSLAY